MDSDFSQLYSQLGLSPQAGVEDLKRAYRRRVGQLHPDRHPDDGGTADTHAEFAQLISLYGMAMRFHRMHGRLPGEAAAIETVPAFSDAPRYVDPTLDSGPTATAQTATAESAGEKMLGRRGWVLLGTLALLVVLAYLDAPGQAARIAPASPDPWFSTQDAAGPGQVLMAPEKLALGMDMALVITIQGRPSYREGDVWEYGPSWLRFDEGQLVEWYSSPLYRLEVSTPTALMPEDPAG